MPRQWDFNVEWPKILLAATTKGVDAYFIAAIRVTENGAPGREFGVLSVSAPDYDAQLRVTCNTVRNQLLAFGGNWFDYNGRLSYQKAFVKSFAQSWAPSSASNDPTHLNANWLENAWDTYLAFADGGGPVLWQTHTKLD